MIDLSEIPNCDQRQDSVAEQLFDLTMIANRMGMYDAADVIVQMAGRLPNIKYGCHIEPHERIFEDCVCDEGEYVS
jgi:hypothetical protein